MIERFMEKVAMEKEAKNIVPLLGIGAAALGGAIGAEKFIFKPARDKMIEKRVRDSHSIYDDKDVDKLVKFEQQIYAVPRKHKQLLREDYLKKHPLEFSTAYKREVMEDRFNNCDDLVNAATITGRKLGENLGVYMNDAGDFTIASNDPAKRKLPIPDYKRIRNIDELKNSPIYLDPSNIYKDGV